MFAKAAFWNTNPTSPIPRTCLPPVKRTMSPDPQLGDCCRLILCTAPERRPKIGMQRSKRGELSLGQRLAVCGVSEWHELFERLLEVPNGVGVAVRGLMATIMTSPRLGGCT